MTSWFSNIRRSIAPTTTKQAAPANPEKKIAAKLAPVDTLTTRLSDKLATRASLDNRLSPKAAEQALVNEVTDLNDILKSSDVDLGSKGEALEAIVSTPALMLIPVGGSKQTLIEQLFARLSKQSNRSAHREIREAHDFLLAGTVMERYRSGADKYPSPKYAELFKGVARQAVTGSEATRSFAGMALQSYTMVTGSEETHRKTVLEVSRAGDVVGAAEMHVMGTMQRVFGSPKEVNKALKVETIAQYYNEAVHELVIAGLAHRLDIRVGANMLSRDGKVAMQVKPELDHLWELQASNQAQHDAAGAGPSALLQSQRDALQTLSAVMPRQLREASPTPDELRERLPD